MAGSRAAGVSEKYITGDASDYEKFCAFAETMPKLLRNPLWHWSHLELSRVFGIKEVLNQSTAQRIWDEANAQLGKISAQTLLAHFRVAAIGTTDDPCDSLSHHIEISKSELKTRVYPAFRPDKALAADDAELFQSWVQRLEQSSGISCNNFDTFLEAIANRHTFFTTWTADSQTTGLNSVLAEVARKAKQPKFTMLHFGETQFLTTHFTPIVAT